MIREHRFHTRDEAANALATVVAEQLRDRLDGRRAASLVVSGGATPVPFFRSLRRQALAWDRVTVTLADERWVPPTHPESNEGLVRSDLLVEEASRARFVGLNPAGATPEEAAEAAEPEIRSLRPFDCVVLGMGLDGHTASLFPGAPGIEGGLERNSRRTCVATDPPTASRLRLTLTAEALLSGRFLALHLTGDDKRATLERALAPGPVEEMPVRSILRWSSAGVDVFWAP
jgi:6-phosphogluconolactonase